MKPGAEGRIAAEIAEPFEGTNERFLGEVAREIIVSRQPKGEAVDPIDVLLVQLALGDRVTGRGACDYFAFDHPVSSVVSVTVWASCPCCDRPWDTGWAQMVAWKLAG